MKILAVEFSSEQRSVAIIEGDGRMFRVCGEAREEGGRNAHVVALIEQTLHQATLEREEIDCIAVGLGPGSYTGIRAALALAQGWQLARGIKVLGISSVECLAECALASGSRGRVDIMVDAQRHEFYLAGYDLSENGAREMEPLHIAGFAEIQRRIAEKYIVLGPEANRIFAGARNLSPEATILGKIAVRKGNFVAGEELEPIYLRETSFVKASPPRSIAGS